MALRRDQVEKNGIETLINDSSLGIETRAIPLNVVCDVDSKIYANVAVRMRDAGNLMRIRIHRRESSPVNPIPNRQLGRDVIK